MFVNDHHILLLSKRFSGDLTPAETAVLNEWLEQSAEHRQLAAELQQVWEKTGGYGKSFTPDLDAAFLRVQDKIRTAAAPQPRSRMIALPRQLMRIAATLAFLLAAVWAYREFSAPEAALTTLVSHEEKQLVRLSDGTQVWLRRDGEIAYPATFGGSDRRITLRGEAYFDVQHNPAKPFRVALDNGGAVEVLGTQFNIRQTGTEISVLVRSGKVRFRPEEKGGSYVLEAGRKAIFNKANGETVEKKVQSYNELAWQTGGLEFIGVPMEQVIADLEAHYNVKINLQNPTMRSCPHTALHTTQPIEKVLESLALTHQLRVTNPAPGQYELLGGTCQ